MSESGWRDRISGNSSCDPKQLKAHSKNWRTHPDQQMEALRGILDKVGWVGQIIINESTGNLLDGHLRVNLAIEAGEEQVPVTYVKLTEEEEEMVLATFDAITGMAGVDVKKLDALTETLKVEYPFVNIAFEQMKVANIVAGFVERYQEDDDEVDFGGRLPGGEEEDDKQDMADVFVTVGPYRTKISRDEFNTWDDVIRDSSGHRDSDILYEIRCRLGFPANED